MSDRLTKSEWLRHGLRTLASEGPVALKVGPMSEKLNVSRGSFYWHLGALRISGPSFCRIGRKSRRTRS